MLAVDTLLMKEEAWDGLELDEGIGIAIAGDPKKSRHLSALHGEMLGEKMGAWRLMMRKCDAAGRTTEIVTASFLAITLSRLLSATEKKCGDLII